MSERKGSVVPFVVPQNGKHIQRLPREHLRRRGAAVPREHCPCPGLLQLLPGQNTALALHPSLPPTLPQARLRGRKGTLFPAAYPKCRLTAPPWRLPPGATGIVVSLLPKGWQGHIPSGAGSQPSPSQESLGLHPSFGWCGFLF